MSPFVAVLKNETIKSIGSRPVPRAYFILLPSGFSVAFTAWERVAQTGPNLDLGFYYMFWQLMEYALVVSIYVGFSRPIVHQKLNSSYHGTCYIDTVLFLLSMEDEDDQDLSGLFLDCVCNLEHVLKTLVKMQVSCS